MIPSLPFHPYIGSPTMTRMRTPRLFVYRGLLLTLPDHFLASMSRRSVLLSMESWCKSAHDHLCSGPVLFVRLLDSLPIEEKCRLSCSSSRLWCQRCADGCIISHKVLSRVQKRLYCMGYASGRHLGVWIPLLQKHCRLESCCQTRCMGELTVFVLEDTTVHCLVLLGHLLVSRLNRGTQRMQIAPPTDWAMRRITSSRPRRRKHHLLSRLLGTVLNRVGQERVKPTVLALLLCPVSFSFLARAIQRSL